MIANCDILFGNSNTLASLLDNPEDISDKESCMTEDDLLA